MKLSNIAGVPLSLAVWLAHDEYDQSGDDRTISATGLLKPTKSIVLGSGISKQQMDVMDLVPSSLGTSIHTAIESAWLSPNLKQSLIMLGYPSNVVQNIKVNPTPDEITDTCIPIYMEIRKTREIGGWNVTGKFDFCSDGKLEDFKSTGTYGYINQSNRDKYIWQGSIYRWLNQDIVTQDTFCINYIFTDWSSAKAKQEEGYPKSRLLQQEYPLKSIAETEAFIKEKLKLIDQGIIDPLSIAPCTPEELWMKPSVFAYYKDVNKMERSTKNFDSYWEANAYQTKNGTGAIIERKGEATFCKYCNARPTCSQAAQLIKEGRLIV